MSDEQSTPTEQELAVAGVQENLMFLQSQVNYLSQRLLAVTVERNRAVTRTAELEALLAEVG